MIVQNGYSIHEYAKQNQIVITLPQTQDTLNCSALPLAHRRPNLTEEELSALLRLVERMYTNGYQIDWQPQQTYTHT